MGWPEAISNVGEAFSIAVSVCAVCWLFGKMFDSESDVSVTEEDDNG